MYYFQPVCSCYSVSIGGRKPYCALHDYEPPKITYEFPSSNIEKELKEIKDLLKQLLSKYDLQ